MDRRQILRLSEAASSEQPDYKEEGDLKYEQNVAYESVPKTLVNISKASEKAVDTVIGGIQDRQSEREKLKGSKQPGLFAKIDEKIEEVLEGLHGKYASSVPKETALRVRSGMCFQKSMEGRERKKGKKMKKLISLLLIVSLIPGIMCSCGKEKEIEESIEFPEDELLSEYRNAADLPMETVQDAGRAVAVYFYRGETKFYGEIYIPEGEGPFPVVIIAGGFATSHYGYQGMAQMFAESGIVGVVFDPSDTGYMGAMIDDYLNWSPLKEAADIESIVSAMSKLSYVDDSNIFLWGHSMGGFASGYVGFKNPGLIKGMVLVEPAFYLNEEAKEQFPDTDDIPEIVEGDIYFGRIYFEDLCSFDIYDLMAAYDRNVAVYAGTESPSIGADMPELLTKAEELLPSCKITYVNTNHFFNGMPMTRVIMGTVSFVKNNMSE